MMQELSHIRQIEGEPQRRMFSGGGMDLLAWVDGDALEGFQLTWEEPGANGPQQKALTWFAGRGYSHMKVDDGEGRPGRYKMSPVLVPDGTLDVDALARRFETISQGIDPVVRGAVLGAIRGYGK